MIVLHHLSELDQSMGREAEAVGACERALAFTSGMPATEAQAFIKLAELYASVGRRQEAEGALRGALAAAEREPAWHAENAPAVEARLAALSDGQTDAR